MVASNSSNDALKQVCSQDAGLVGTPGLLLLSANVTEAPPRVNTPVPAPSVYKDGRGEIHNIKVGGKRVNILFTKQHVMRSGDIHENTQHDFIFSGQVELWILRKGETEKKIYGPYEYLSIPPYVPHVFHFLQDTVMAEWWEPGSFHAWFYEPYRSIVQQSFSSKERGELVKMVSEKKDIYNRMISVAALSGLLAGLAIGFAAGRRKP